MGGSGRRLPWLVRLALYAFPARFRSEFGADMAAAYADGDRGSVARRLVRVVRVTADVVVAGLRERRSPVQEPLVDDIESTFTRKRGFMVDHLVRDLRHALRALVKRPAFTVIAVVTLALGIGANTAVFSIVNAVLLRPLPYEDPDGLVLVWAHGPENPQARGVMSEPDVDDGAALPALSTLVGYRPGETTLTGSQEPELISISRVTRGLLATFGLKPVLGRDLTDADDVRSAPLVTVISHAFWQTRLGGRRDVLGTTIELAGWLLEIVGVAPPGFDFPDRSEAWVSRRLSPEGCGRGCHTLYALGRLAPDATLESAQSQLSTLATRLSQEFPQTNTNKRFRAVRLADDRVADVRTGLWFVFGSVVLVLLIACANVANLLLVRGESRRSEVAVRAALGASRGRLASQVIMESAVLASVGAAGGVLLALAGVQLIRRIPAETVPRIETVSLDVNVLWFALAMGLAVALLFGLSPALHQSKVSLASNLVTRRRGEAGPRARRSRGLLLATEVALSVLLLTGAGLLLRSFDRLYRTDLGFEPDQLTRFGLALPSVSYDTLPKIVTFYETLEERLAALPGVEAVGSGYGAPLTPFGMTGDVHVEGRPVPEPGAETGGTMHPVTTGYLDTHRIMLLRGRWIEPSDRTESVPVAVVSEQFVRENFQGEDPLGRRFRVTADFGYGAPMWTIIGVVNDVQPGLTAEPRADVYIPHSQFGPGSLTVTIRTRPGAAPSFQTLRDLVRSLDTSLPLRSYETVLDAVHRETAPTRFYLTTVGAFAALAVLLACVGLYGVVGYLVARRTPEIGIRMALGARREQVVTMVLAQGVRPAAWGVALGVILALAFGRVAESLLFQVSPRDPLILSGVSALMVIVTLAAAFLPARRASRIDPVTALRVE